MLDFVDIQYAQHLSGRLDRYRIKHTNPYKINFRCPLCGDSKKNRSKARGWLLEKDNKLFYFCHNCGASHAFANFLKVIDPLAYNDYIAEKYIGKANNTLISVESTLETTKFEQPKFSHTERLKKLKKVSQLDHTNPVKKYIDTANTF